MDKHRYSLEKGSKKHYCPDCNKKTFVLYIDTETGDYLPKQYGRCDRESKCLYHLNPYLDGYAKAIWVQEQGKRSNLPNNRKPQRKKGKPQPSPESVFFDFDTFRQTLKANRYEQNTFIQNLLLSVPYPFDTQAVTRVIELYRLGTVSNGYRAGATTFPFIDIKGNVRSVQVKQFDEQNHTTGTDFLHSIIEKHRTRNNKPLPEWLEAYKKQDKRVSCLFGEHLLSKYHSNPVALVEAPKTAVYGTLYFGLPQTPESLVWLAVYNKSSFSFDKLTVLKGRFVYVFPDLSENGNTFNEWETKAKQYERCLPGTRFIFSELLEQLAPEKDKKEGNDLADYLIKQDWRTYRKWNTKEQPSPKPEHGISIGPKLKILDQSPPIPDSEIVKSSQIEPPIKEQSESWNNSISELETYFANIEIPAKPVKLNRFSTITDCSKFIKCHFATVKANNSKRTFLPYLNRLKKLKQLKKH
ncbi:DUF6965 family protein [Cyclobacterium roseum]|uniref:DUF6965 family protein n=1 Tax=Cyclobacterium roseum TaxID=2666137 RepID=UPI00192EE7D0|nr:DUF6371 domain-containing protein [Cyclobacterium roseum]